MIGDSNDENNFTHKLLLANIHVSRIRKVFVNNKSANTELSKTQICKIVKSGGFLDKFLGLLIRVGIPLMKNVLAPLAKSVLMLLDLRQQRQQQI